MSEVRLVLSTAPDAETAGRLSRALVEERLAACANVLPGVFSIYWWEGRVQEANEHLILMKAPSSRIGELLSRLQQLHPYEVPEALVFEVGAGLPAYLDWVLQEARATER